MAFLERIFVIGVVEILKILSQLQQLFLRFKYYRKIRSDVAGPLEICT